MSKEATFGFKSRTVIGGHCARTVATVAKDEGKEVSVMVVSRILMPKEDVVLNEVVVKEYKNMCVVERMMFLRLESFMNVLEAIRMGLDSINEGEEGEVCMKLEVSVQDCNKKEDSL